MSLTNTALNSLILMLGKLNIVNGYEIIQVLARNDLTKTKPHAKIHKDTDLYNMLIYKNSFIEKWGYQVGRKRFFRDT